MSLLEGSKSLSKELDISLVLRGRDARMRPYK